MLSVKVFTRRLPVRSKLTGWPRIFVRSCPARKYKPGFRREVGLNGAENDVGPGR